jgi:hypothetical protein
MNNLDDYNSDGSEEQQSKAIEIKELDELQELDQDIPWNQYITVKSVLKEEEIPGEFDEFQIKSLQKLAILRSKGLHFNDQLMATKAFKNPCIMEKMLDYHNIDPYGSFIVTNYSFKNSYVNLNIADKDQIKEESVPQKDRTIQFVKSKSNYYDKRRRI